MYKILEKTYKIDEVTKRENVVKNQNRVLQKQLSKLKDTKKAIRGQNRFFKDIEKVDGQMGFNENVEERYTEAKKVLRELKDQFR
jgi:small-conductance mechanosensitive channel